MMSPHLLDQVKVTPFGLECPIGSGTCTIMCLRPADSRVMTEVRTRA